MPSQEDIDHVDQLVKQFNAEMAARPSVFRQQAKIPMTPKYATKLQLAEMADARMLAARPDLRAALEDYQSSHSTGD